MNRKRDINELFKGWGQFVPKLKFKLFNPFLLKKPKKNWWNRGSRNYQ